MINRDKSAGLEFSMGALLFYAVALYCLTFVFEGFLRFVLQSAGAGTLLYLRDLVPLSLFAYLGFRWVKGDVIPLFILLAGVAILVHFLIGRYVLPTLFQSLFGLKVMLPFFVGVLVVFFCGDRLVRGNWVVWVLLISLAGVAVNYFVEMPWEGELLDTAFGTFSQSRNWTAGGVRRLAGLTRASFDAAAILMVLGIIQLSRMRFGVAWMLACVAVFAGIAATTTKGAMLGFLAFLVFAVLTWGGARQTLAKALVIAAGAVVATVPLISLYFSFHLRSISEGAYWLFSSFVERLNGMWPAAFALLDSPLALVFGRGIGGIGVAQAYGDWWNLNAADNMFVYMFVSFGVFGCFYYMALLAVLTRRNWGKRDHVLLFNGLSLAIVCYGLTANVVESAVLSASLGVLIARNVLATDANR